MMPTAARPGRRRLGRGFLRFVGLRSNRPSQGVHDGTENGDKRGSERDHQRGSPRVHRRDIGWIIGGQQHGVRHGYQQGQSNGASHASEIEQALGLELHIVDGVVLAYQPGYAPAPDAKDQAAAFLRWLQSQDHFRGNEVPARLLQDGLYPLFCSSAGWEPYAWRRIAGHFRRLPGVKRRQYDGRTGSDRTGSMPTVYKIPHPRG